MRVYVGFGFNTDHISDEVLIALMKKYDRKRYNKLKKRYPNKDMKSDGIYARAVFRFSVDSVATWLCDIINKNESEKANTDHIVSNEGQYVVFESVRFAGNEKRAEYIRTEKDFIKMIERYIPVSNIAFRNLYVLGDFTFTHIMFGD